MKDATVESEIIKLVEQLCETFPAPYSSLCDSLVEQYVPLIMQWIEEGLESLDVCSKIGLCSTQGKKTVRLPKKYVPNTPEGCETCKRWFGWALEKLEEITYEALWMLIFEECPKVPYLKYFCEVINEENLDTFYSLLKSSLPPEQCCEWVKAC
ncbi:hypothetical protein TRFO_09344 [Tritrichomonas foetus]|uniref:Saposin B-type domain-containing protein n=1 Tax=Tritrichomonas foetus TaxID=1144522 RepID=A0A1J4JEL4_9EUKA|nr:hypothetical protein TRFO_09344 [Tritrichomonas foetus]|eukprot:OHS97638.1 hypothetical protein TRFO_09344 [Tritrichomonas foetus]